MSLNVGVVFNVSRYMSFHPGGIPELMKGVGKDATKLFDDVSTKSIFYKKLILFLHIFMAEGAWMGQLSKYPSEMYRW